MEEFVVVRLAGFSIWFTVFKGVDLSLKNKTMPMPAIYSFLLFN